MCFTQTFPFLNTPNSISLRIDALRKNGNFLSWNLSMHLISFAYLVRNCNIISAGRKDTIAPIHPFVKNLERTRQSQRYRKISCMCEVNRPNGKFRCTDDIKSIDRLMCCQKSNKEFQPSKRFMQANEINAVHTLTRLCIKMALSRKNGNGMSPLDQFLRVIFRMELRAAFCRQAIL